jgi:hypothetical protein
MNTLSDNLRRIVRRVHTVELSKQDTVHGRADRDNVYLVELRWPVGQDEQRSGLTGARQS